MSSINWTNVTDLSQLPSLANTASDGSFWAGMVFMIWIVLLLLFISWGWEIALLVSAGVCLFLATLFVYTGLIAWWIVLFFLSLILFMILYITFSSQRR